MIVCIDSQIIIWGIKKQPATGQEDMVAKAEAFFDWVDKEEHDVIVPSVVAAEVLVPEPDEIRAQFLGILTKNFIIADFDTRAALKYAQLLHGRFEEIKRIAAVNDTTRQKMKVDHLIISTAIVNNASCIYSYDKALKPFAFGHIDVREFPGMSPRQGDLFPS
jgi:predicted nucleic acid-binding protein